MTRRYYVPQLPSEPGEFCLPPEESRHASAVMRVRSGDRIELFDGADGVAAARVTSVEKRRVQCSVESFQQQSLEPSLEVTACVAIPKGDRSRVLVEKLTELGVSRLIPLNCQHSQWRLSPAALEKLRRQVIEACKQSGRNRLMVITEPRESVEFFGEASELPDGGPRFLAHPAGGQQRPGFSFDEPVSFAIGPEGGFSDCETAAADRSGWQRVSLGPRIYRIETAAVALAARLIHD